MKKTVLLAALLFLGCALPGVEIKTVPGKKGNSHSAENKYLKITVSPTGGVLQEFVFKPGNLHFPAGRGMATEMDWKITSSREYLWGRPFILGTGKSKNSGMISAVGQHSGAGIDFLKVSKNYVLKDDCAALNIEYDFKNMPEAMGAYDYAPKLHFHLSPKFGKAPLVNQVFLPLHSGIVSGRSFDQAVLARPWMAICGKEGGLAAVLKNYSDLSMVLAWRGSGSQTLEFFVVPVKLDMGQSWKNEIELIPFTGLKQISGAGGGLVGEVVSTPVKNGKSKVSVRISSARRGAVDARVFIRTKKGGSYEQLLRKKLNYSAPATVQGFDFDLKVAKDSLCEIEVVLRVNRRKAARLNHAVFTGSPKRMWSIEPLSDTRKSSIKEMSISQFNNVYPFKVTGWATPLSSGTIKLLPLVNHVSIPDIMMLARQLDIKYEAPILGIGLGKLVNIAYVLNEYFNGVTTDRQVQEVEALLKKNPEVILLGGAYSWSAMTPALKEKIMEKVKLGCGLVVIGSSTPTEAMTKNAKGRYALKCGRPVETVKDHFLTSGIPMGSFASARLWNMTAKGQVIAKAGSRPLISVMSYGKGRIVTLNYVGANNAAIGSYSGAIGPEESYYNVHNGSPVEYYFSLIAKAVFYAAGRTPDVTFGDFKAGEKLSWQLNSRKAFSGKLEYTVTNSFNKVMAKNVIPVKLAAGKQPFTVARPDVTYSGTVIINMILRNAAGKVVNWGAWELPGQAPALITSAASDRKNYKDGDQVKVKVKLNKVLPDSMVKFELIDSYDRVIALREVKAAKEVSCALLIDNALPSKYARVKCSLLKGKKEIDAKLCEIWVRPKEELLKWDDFPIYTGWPTYLPLYQAEGRNDVYRNQLYITGMSAIENGRDNQYSRYFNYGLIDGAHGNYACSDHRPADPPHVIEYRRTGNKMLLANPRCLSDPKRVAASVKTLKKTAERGYYAGSKVFMGSDETSLTGRWGKNIDYCFSEHCLKRFRIWLRKRYGTIAKLNKAWETGFASWDKVIPFTIDEVWKAKGKHIAGWADHIEFMDDVWMIGLGHVSQVLKSKDPNVLFGQSGTPSPRTYGGMDWWKQMKSYDFCSGYDSGGQAELRRSFKMPTYRGMTWALGYGAKPASQITSLWRAVFMGYSGVNSFTTRCMSRPDWTMPSETKAIQPAMKALTRGTGKYFVNLIRENPPTALILYSQSSIRASFYDKIESEHSQCRLKFIALFRGLGLDFKFISYEQLGNGLLDKMKSVKLLALPNSSALSDAECTAIEKFIRRGGQVIAEGAMPGIRNSNCTLRKASPLAKYFNGKYANVAWDKKIDTEYTKLLPGGDVPQNEIQINRRRAAVLRLLKQAGVKLRPVLVKFDGKPQVNVEYFRYSDPEGNQLLCTLSADKGGIHTMSGSAAVSSVKQLTYKPGKAVHLYDLVNGRYLGYGKEFKVPFSALHPHALLSLKHPIQVASFSAAGNKLSLQLKYPVSTVVRVTVFGPDGRERECYARNQIVCKGKAEWVLPFAISDAAGKWSVRIQDVCSGLKAETVVVR